MLTAIRKERTIEWMTGEIYFKACDSEGSWFILMNKIQPLLIHIIDMCWPSTVISCFFYNHVSIVTGNSLNYFVKIHFILFEKHFTEREWERDRESEPSIYRFPLEMVPMTKAELIWTQNPGVSPGSSTWVKRQEYLLGHPHGWRGPRTWAMLYYFHRSSAGSWTGNGATHMWWWCLQVED